MTPFDFLGALLERIHARSPVVSYIVASLIAAACMYVVAVLNADGTSAVANLVRT
ncbi:hypothetical protein KDW20_33315 [Burkholderia cenocepacia]|uniref:hypothetical protein n=1 Tax=Burkholderia cepacia complex TaxID=87882 RepID=UPI0018FED174|nr:MULTISPECIES: hypothetical protein [Burkholderia cepacia complex]MBR8380661.1 hypothetical protein [Burkholderia cenocepacia]